MTDALHLRQPRLVAFARYRWDKVREQHQIVYPEGVLVLNETGAQTVKLLDGRPIEELIDELTKRFDDADVGPDVREFLAGLFDHGLLRNG